MKAVSLFGILLLYTFCETRTSFNLSALRFCFCFIFFGKRNHSSLLMSKSKVASQKGLNRKCHRNGIHKPKKHTKISPVGMNIKYLHNCHYARIGMKKDKQE